LEAFHPHKQHRQSFHSACVHIIRFDPNASFGHDGVYRAYLNTGAAIGAFRRIDDIDFITFADGFHGAFGKTRAADNTFFGYSMSHDASKCFWVAFLSKKIY
jgi:hypothetical protein